MIRFQRSRKFMPHHKDDALRYARQASELANKIVPGVHFQIFSGRFDTVERVYWVADLEGFVALETTLETLEKDQRWKEFIAKTPKNIFVDGSSEETVLELVA